MSRLLLAALVILGAVFGAGGTWLAERVAPGDLNAADKTRIERVVRDYVAANPELVSDAIDTLRDRETGRMIAASRTAIETPLGNAWAGNPAGDVTVVEYFDYNCGYCRAILPVIDQLVKADPKVRVVFKELPVLAESSQDAAKASIQAAADGKFAQFHRALYAAGPVTAATIAGAARVAGVDLSRPNAAAAEEISRNIATAGRLGMSGTPGWVIGDRVLVGAQPLDRLREAVAAARAR